MKRLQRYCLDAPVEFYCEADDVTELEDDFAECLDMLREILSGEWSMNAVEALTMRLEKKE